MNNLKKNRWVKTLSTAVLGAALALASLSGCGGSGSGPAGQVPTAIYEGSSPFLGNLRTGEVLLRTYANNTLDGTITVAQDSAHNTNSSAGGAPLPPGSYTFNGTVTGNNFSGQGRFLGTPSFNFTISGVFPTSSLLGLITLKGSTSEGAFDTYVGFYQTTGAAGLNANFLFSGLQNSNVNVTPLINTVNNGLGGPPVAGVVQLFGSFSAIGTTPSTSRTLIISLRNFSPYQVGDTFPMVTEITSSTGESAQVSYSEGAPVTKYWFGESGTAKVAAINGQKVTLQLINVKMKLSALADDGVPNQGTGSFTLNGTGTVVVDRYALTGSFN